MCCKVSNRRTPAILRNVTLILQKRCYQCQSPSQFQYRYQIQFQFQSRSKFQFQFSKRTRRVSNATMHSLDAVAAQSLGTVSQVQAPIIETCFTYTPEQKQAHLKSTKIADLVRHKTANRQFFYGIEITGHTNNELTCVDFNTFLPILPTFISIVWLPTYFNIEPIENVETLQMIRNLEPHIPAMPHLSVYRMTKERIDQFLDLKFANLLAVRGDKMQKDQPFHYSHQLVEHARRARGDNISICVAGHPQGYLNLSKDGKPDNHQSMEYLKKKVEAGADFIITQICFSPVLLVKFLKDARSAGIDVPIMVGVVVPDSWKTFALIEMISNAKLLPEVRAEVAKFKDDDEKAKNFFVQLALRIIRAVLDADVGIYGIQFYTMNRFGSVQDVICELRKEGILKEPPTDQCGDS